jgi:hypothetical protein
MTEQPPVDSQPVAAWAGGKTWRAGRKLLVAALTRVGAPVHAAPPPEPEPAQVQPGRLANGRMLGAAAMAELLARRDDPYIFDEYTGQT